MPPRTNIFPLGINAHTNAPPTHMLTAPCAFSGSGDSISNIFSCRAVGFGSKMKMAPFGCCAQMQPEERQNQLPH